MATHIAASRILLALLLGVIAAAANVIGGWAIVRGQWSRAFLKYFIALGAGFMLATAFLEMIPESLKLTAGVDKVFFLVLAGYLLVHFFEHTLAPHFHFGEETHHDELASRHAGIAAVLGLVIHTFFDGVAIASGVLVSTWLGGVIFLAVFLHKLPEGSTVASLMLASGQSRRIALLSSVALGGATLAGVGLMYLLRGAVDIALPFSAGVTVYVAASDLMPEVNREPAVGMPILVFLGVLAMLLLKLTFHL
jgi:zinc and cadmium transporter